MTTQSTMNDKVDVRTEIEWDDLPIIVQNKLLKLASGELDGQIRLDDIEDYTLSVEAELSLY